MGISAVPDPVSRVTVTLTVLHAHRALLQTVAPGVDVDETTGWAWLFRDEQELLGERSQRDLDRVFLAVEGILDGIETFPAEGRAFEALDLRIAIISNDNMNAGFFLPLSLLRAVVRNGVDVLISAY